MEYVYMYAWPYAKYKISEYYKKYFGESVQVNIVNGPIVGIQIQSQFGYKYIGFQGVPYAKPPVGPLRFKDPEPIVDSWTTPLLTTTDKYACQKDMVTKNILGTEDCLYVNVYTKCLEPPALAPVMVFIHGGGFVYGSNAKDIYNPEYLLRKNVVVVVINYRLGAFGFLSIDDETEEIPGNAGLKDQVIALKWVKDNVDKFGGDPNNITLFGESAGGCSVHYHMMSEMSKGLFNKAIAMSGTVFNPWSIVRLKSNGERLAKALGWDGAGGTRQYMQVLRNASPQSIIKAQETLLTKDERQHYVLFPFGPKVEPYTSKQCFLPKDPKDLCENAWSKEMPLIISGCADEGLLVYKETKKHAHRLEGLSAAFERTVPFDLETDRTSNRCKELGAALKKFYFGYTEPSMATIDSYVKLMGDKLFWHAIHRALHTRIAPANAGPTYLLRFDFDSDHNFSKLLFAGKSVKGACHADDCAYLFKMAISPSVDESSKEFETIKRMVDIFTSFATSGDPNTAPTVTALGAPWQPITTLNIPYICLNINNDVTYIQLPEYEQMQFWDSLYPKL